MYNFFIQSSQVRGDYVRLDGDDVNHIKNVLRMRIGERLYLTDEDTARYTCEIKKMDRDFILAYILDREAVSHELSSSVTLYQGIPKGDRFELIIQKAVELGVCEIVPVITKRCVVRLDDKKRENRVKRWNAIAKSAAEQSGRNIIPKVAEPVCFKDAVNQAESFDLVCIPYEQAEGMESTRKFFEKLGPGINVAFYIGPEGGYDEAEVEYAINKNVWPVSLGKRILRTETAAIALMSTIMLKLEFLGDSV